VENNQQYVENNQQYVENNQQYVENNQQYVENNQQHALNSILPYFSFSFLHWTLHVSTKHCHPQGATIFLSKPLQRQYGRSQV
jgi:hypothetical protein